ncbi:class IV lanthionine synthetase LanL [Streptomyces sp. NPDC055109]
MQSPASDGHRKADSLFQSLLRGVLVSCAEDRWHQSNHGMWCHVLPATNRPQVQGWKLHISATVLSAPLVLATAADILIRRDCRFKFARTLEHVQQLNSRQIERGSGGKFITAYPACDSESLRNLAEELHYATLGIPGPRILSDLPYMPGSLVHYRFGAFMGVPSVSDEGLQEAMLVAPDGKLVIDNRKAWFAPPSWAPLNPFPVHASSPRQINGSQSYILRERYEIGKAIRHSFTGSVYRAIDLQTGKDVVIKQARNHAGGNITGQDAKDRQRNEANMLQRLQDCALTPDFVDRFEYQGDSFLVMDAVDGVTLRDWVTTGTNHESRGDYWGLPADTLHELARALVDLVAQVHAEGLVLQDLSPDNLMVVGDKKLWLIDLEMIAAVGESAVPAYTPGYGAPESVIGLQPITLMRAETDIFSLGAVLFFLATGIDPILGQDMPAVGSQPIHEKIRTWLNYLSRENQAAREISFIPNLMHESPERRPSIVEIREFLTRQHSLPNDFDKRGRRDINSATRQMITDFTQHLIKTMDCRNSTQLWPHANDRSHDSIAVQHGAAGVVMVLARVFLSTSDVSLKAALRTANRWVTDRLVQDTRLLPGLYYGRSGTAWALLESAKALNDRTLLEIACDTALRIPTPQGNPDISHGLSGAGMAYLKFFEETGKTEFLEKVRQCARNVAAVAETCNGRIMWVTPGIDRPKRHYGFAHGVAGCGTFLLGAGRALGNEEYVDLARKAANTLAASVRLNQNAAYWPYSDEDANDMTHWCSGSSGIGTFLIRIWQHTSDDEYGHLAKRAAVAVRRSRWRAGTTQCHGLAGHGDFLLDLADASGEKQYFNWAQECAEGISVRLLSRNEHMIAVDGTQTETTADFGTGLSGLLSFLIRLENGGARPWIPGALTIAP